MLQTAEGKTTVIRGSKVPASSYSIGKKRPNEASGLIYLTCQGQNTTNWGNMLTSPPQADEDLVLCGFLCSRRGKKLQYTSSSYPVHIQHSDYIAIWLVCWVIPLRERSTTNKQRAMRCASQSFKSASHFPWHKSFTNSKMPFCINQCVTDIRTSGAKATLNPTVLGTHSNNSLQPSY